MSIILKTDEEIDIMRRGGIFAYTLLDEIEKILAPGISTQDINDLGEKLTQEAKGRSAPLNYRGFPRSLCTSVNNVICHGIPKKEDILKEGDIVNVDVTPIIEGYHADTSRTFTIGSVSKVAQELTDCARHCLELGIQAVQPYGKIGDIGQVITDYARTKGFSVVRDYVGHGIGKGFHEEPAVSHVGKKGQGVTLKPGMVFTIEPMVNEGKFKTKLLKDGWTVITVDGKLSAQFEHTVAIRSNGDVQVLTAAP